MFELKTYREVMCHENDAKLEKELTFCFKIDMKNFDPSTQKSQTFAL